MAANAMHLSLSQEWFTPEPILDFAREVLGEIDVDPASCEEANERVKAKRYFSIENPAPSVWVDEDHQTVFLNPPGGKTGNKSNAQLFWYKLMEQRSSPHFKGAIFVVFNLNMLQTTQSLLAHTLCFFRRRVAYDQPAHMGSKRGSPSHGSALVYVSGSEDKSALFKSLGNEIFGMTGQFI